MDLSTNPKLLLLILTRKILDYEVAEKLLTWLQNDISKSSFVSPLTPKPLIFVQAATIKQLLFKEHALENPGVFWLDFDEYTEIEGISFPKFWRYL